MAESNHPPPEHDALFWVDAGLSLAVGLAVAAQSRINGELGARLNNGVEAAWWSIGTGLLILLVGLLVLRDARAAIGRLARAVRSPGSGQAPALRWWFLLGGLGGAMIVASQGLVVPALGVAAFTVAVVAGQTGNSLLADALGAGPGGRRQVTGVRVVASIVATAGVFVAVVDRFGETNFNLWLVLLGILGGALVAVQQAFNGRVAVAVENVWTATLVNFVVGLAALTLVLGAWLVAVGELSAPPAPWREPWLWLGGPIGVAFVGVSAFVVGRLGVLLFSLLTIAGQLVGALALDVFWPTEGATVSGWLIAGTAITAVAVMLAARPPANA